MFAQIFPALLSHCQVSAFETPQPSFARLARIESDAAQALRGDFHAFRLSERLHNPDAYRALQARRREALLLLLMLKPTDDVMRSAVDLIGMIVEEISWSANSRSVFFDDDNHPNVDFAAAETAVLFGWTVHKIGAELDRLDTAIVSRMRGEVRRRLFKPVMVHDDYPFMTGEGACPIAVAVDVLLSALLLETEEARLGRIVKPALKLLDEVCGRHGRELAPLWNAVADISAVTDLAVLIRDMTNQRVDLSGSVPAGDWLDEILYSWIQDDRFNDPAGDGMRPALSGSDIYRIGSTAQDPSLTELGAHLYHQNHLPSQTVTGRLMELACQDELDGTFGKPQRLRYAALRNNLLMAARVPGLYCSMHVGGAQGNAGDLCLFADSAPIVVDGGRACPARSVPVLAGKDQLRRPTRPCIADFEAREDREILSVDLTYAYPAACGLRSYQRTVLTLREEQVVRIVDALDFETPQNAVFRFVCAVRPAILTSAIRLGPARMTWEGDFEVSARPLNEDLTLIELNTIQPVRQAFFAFNWERT